MRAPHEATPPQPPPRAVFKHCRQIHSGRRADSLQQQKARLSLSAGQFLAVISIQSAGATLADEEPIALSAARYLRPGGSGGQEGRQGRHHHHYTAIMKSAVVVVLFEEAVARLPRASPARPACSGQVIPS